VLEKIITNKVLSYLKSLDHCFCFKNHGGRYGTAGIPDIICCFHGRFLAFEVKTDKGKLTKLQETMMERIQKAKGNAYKVTSVEEVKKILEHLEDEFYEC